MKATLVAAVMVLAASEAFAQAPGSLNPPPGPIGPTMKSLEQVDPGTPLDPAQFPATGYVITQPGSYYLIGNVSAIDATEAAITINASDVTLDLRGFSITPRTGSGIAATDAGVVIAGGLSNVTVRNGAIVGPWYAGVYSTSPACTVRGVRVANTNAYGIRLIDGAQVTDCAVEGSGVSSGTSGRISVTGISVGIHSIVKSSSAMRCGGDGFAVGSRSLVLDSTAHDNGSDGLVTLNGTVVSRVSTNRNTARGMSLEVGCVIAQAVSNGNGTTGLLASDATNVAHATASTNATGFSLGKYSALSDCTASTNTGTGFIAGGGSALRNSTAAKNGNDGFRIAIGSVLLNCGANANGRDAANAVVNAAADGFELAAGARLSHCEAQWNGGAGIRATSFSHYIDSSTAVLNGGSTSDDIVLPNNGSVVIWSRIGSITPAPSNFIGPFNDARTTKPFSNF